MELDEQLEQLHPAGFAWALACCDRDRDAAQEVLQDVYLKVLEGKARFDGRSSLKTWFFAVIRKTAAAQRRTRWLRLRVQRNASVIAAPEEETIERRLICCERTAGLLWALRRLSRRQREVLELVFYHDMTIEQAGQTLEISLGSARTHYERGKKQLRHWMEVGSR